MDGSNDNNRELLENVTISDVGGSQYMIQRMSVDNSQLLNTTDLLTHHSGLVVDLGGTDFIPVNYTSEELQQLTEEDRNLAAALVAVQLSQQQKQQQQIQQDTANVLNSTIPGLVTNTSLESAKVSLNDQQLLLSEKGVLNDGYLQIVGTNNLYENYNPNQHIKSEEDLNLKDSDGENKIDVKTSRKSLPHKKRISRKLKKPLQTSRKLNRCSLCEQTFSNNDEYLQHQQLCQTTITPIVTSALFNCQICQGAFHDQLTFFEHLKTHYEPSIQVHIQESTTGDLIQGEELKESIKIEAEAPKDSLLSSLLNLHCIHCNKSFRRQKAFEAHMRDAHSKDDLNEFSEPEDLMAGIDVVVDPNEANSEEDVKAWTEYRDDELYATEEDLKELEAQDHVCHLCKQPFPMRAILLQHLITCREANNQLEASVDVPKKKPKKKSGELSCTECDRVFTHRNSLVYHMRSHTGDRPHQCEQCGKSFFAASALKVHKRLHSGDKPYKCEHCGRSFRQWGDLKYHTISLHSNQKQYQCEYCGKDFARKYSLIVHRRIHTGEKNYKCEFCGKTFRASSYLQNHRRIHTGEKPHNCDVCGKPFRVRSDMKRHMKTHVRRKINRPPNASPNSCNLIITKLEESENVESILPDSEDTSELTNDKQENSIEIQYDQDSLVAERDGSTLYTNGHQVFVFYSGDLPVRTSDASNPSWIQTN